ncbi:MAG: FAD-binding oxidoreductase, partial [Chloroflexota bacterium]
MNKNADVVVMGAGIIGCAIAYNLAKRGCKAIVLEKKERICSGASGANSGGAPVSEWSPHSPALDLVKESVKLYEKLSEEIDYDIEYQKVGLLQCALDDAQYLAIKEHARGMKAKGIDINFLDGDEIRKIEPSLGENIIAGIEDEISGMLNPFKATHGLARAARKLGAEFLLATEARAIEVDRDKVTAVVTDKGRIITGFVVNAAGIGSPEVGKLVGLTMPVQPARGQVIVSEPVALNNRWRYILDADHLKHKETPAKGSGDHINKLDVSGGWLQENTGNWIIGSNRELSHDKNVSMLIINLIAKKALTFMPKLKGVHCIRTFAGLRPRCYIDDLPILGKVDNPSGFVIATGHFSAGVTLAPITGKLIAELIIDNKTS